MSCGLHALQHLRSIGQKLGTEVIRSLEKIAQKQEFKKILVHSELTAATFYETLGYIRNGNIYQEDGVDCINLIKSIESSNKKGKLVKQCLLFLSRLFLKFYCNHHCV